MDNLDFDKADLGHRCDEHDFSEWQWSQNTFGDWRCLPPNRRSEWWWQKRKGKGKGPKSRSRSTRGKKTLAVHEETRSTAPKQPKCLAESHKPATTGGGEHAEYVAQFMEAWKHQADIVRWIPNPRAPEFIPGGMGSQTYYDSAMTAEAAILEEQLWDTTQAQYEEAIRKQYEIHLHQDFVGL
ncbi:MAG: hypothetical protein Q9172_005130 [Xanthocarpia lactea]